MAIPTLRDPSGTARRDTLRLLAEPVAFAGDAADALLTVRDLPCPFALSGRWAGGGALVGACPRQRLSSAAEAFAALDALALAFADHGDAPAGAVGGGWFGWLGYRGAHAVEELPPGPPRPDRPPEAYMGFYDHLLRRDPGGRWWVEGLAPPGGEEEVRERMGILRERLSRPVSAAVPVACGPMRVAAPGHAGHRWAVGRAVERIAAGDLFQVNLGLRLQGRGRIDPVDLYVQVARAVEPAYGAVFAREGGGIVSLSPELFLRRRGRDVTTGPIKGTVARTHGGEAESARAELLASGKDAAEHVMIVDLMRNDLGRVCEFGSVTREERRRVEPHPGVWHLVSDVSGRLRDGTGDGELLRATFPPGSVTGAPKVQALKLVAELEGSGRELYTGAIGYASPAAGLEMSVAIRTFECAGDSLWLGAGGGIVAESEPAAELAEALAKARPLVAAAGGHIAGEAGSTPSGDYRSAVRALARLPRATTFAARPDSRHGVFETVLVEAGRPISLDAHLVRLAAAASDLYGAELSPGVGDEALHVAARAGNGRLRIHAVPAASSRPNTAGGVGDGTAATDAAPGPAIDVWCEAAPAPVPARGSFELVPFVLPGGLGAHKWRDRRLLDALAAAAGGLPLLVDADGAVLEAAWASLFVERDGEHVTPVLDGRLLPGVGRARRLSDLRAAGTTVAERVVSLAELGRGAITLTSSLRCAPARLRSR